MNYRYTAKKYKNVQDVRPGDTIEILSGASIGHQNADNLRGFVLEIMPNPQVINGAVYANVLIVSIPGMFNLYVDPRRIKLISRQKKLLAVDKLEAWLNHGSTFNVSPFKALSLPNDRGIFITYNDILVLIERRSIKLNKNHSKYKIMLPIFERFSDKHKIPIRKLNKPNFRLNSAKKASPFWKIDKSKSSDDEVRRYNDKILARQITPTDYTFTTS